MVSDSVSHILNVVARQLGMLYLSRRGFWNERLIDDRDDVTHVALFLAVAHGIGGDPPGAPSPSSHRSGSIPTAKNL